MALEKITSVSGRAVHVPGADIDTDRIIPARFMKCVTFDGLGEFAFYDVRFDPDTGEKTDHPLNNPRFEGATILLAGVNFGCGSYSVHSSHHPSTFCAVDLSFHLSLPTSSFRPHRTPHPSLTRPILQSYPWHLSLFPC